MTLQHDDGQALESAAQAVESLMAQAARRLFAMRPDDPLADLPTVQVKICALLQDGPTSISDIAHELGTTLSAVTQLSDRLERAGLVFRKGAAYDRRVKLIELTEHGANLLRDRREFRRRRVLRAIEHLTEDERTRLLSSLRLLLEATWGAHSATSAADDG